MILRLNLAQTLEKVVKANQALSKHDKILVHLFVVFVQS